ncbi:hypothetical protein CKO37_09685 [Rubrivivax gelatinosus]|nr:hypothetical protein [Rubrivivax gelatinosus]
MLTVPTATAIELAQAADSDAVRMLRQAVLNVPSSIRMTFVDSQGSVVVAQFDNTFEKFNNNFDKAVV